ncbi:hypothetical protein FJY84_04165 [Candidatus Bathyarchaeota archaeon]|nr:hypothetical protein [Candidatus Bathyarchaeota archaeon]
MTIKEIAQSMGEPSAGVVHAIDVLEESKLIQAIVLKDAPYIKEVVLTPVGFTIAEKIKEIEELIGWMGRNGVI